MLDRVTHQHGPSRVDVHEHRAPTDDSIRLLREMEEKTRAAVIDALTPGGNDVQGRVVLMADCRTMSRRMVVLFTLNGVKHEYDIPVADPRLTTLDRREVMREMVRKLSEAIAVKLLAEQRVEGS